MGVMCWRSDRLRRRGSVVVDVEPLVVVHAANGTALEAPRVHAGDQHRVDATEQEMRWLARPGEIGDETE